MSLRDLTCDELFDYWEYFIKSGNDMKVTIGDHKLFVSYNSYYKAYCVIYTYNDKYMDSRLYFKLLYILTFSSNLVENGNQPHFELKWRRT